MTSGLSLWGIDGNTHCTSFNTSQTIYFQVIAAEGEQKASRALKEASDIISESKSALQLRYLQTLNSIAAEKNSTIVFPLPIDFISHFMNKSKPPSPDKEEKID